MCYMNAQSEIKLLEISKREIEPGFQNDTAP